MKYLINILMVVVFSVTATGCGACVDDKDVVRAVEKQGYSEVSIKDKSIFFVSWSGCSDSDAAKYDAKAKNPKGDSVDIIVCAGWPFKGVTVRTK